MVARKSAADSSEPHHLVIEGRRWRKSDPNIPAKLRSELVHALMAARRAVLAAKRSASAPDEKAARARVHDAKLALGERGRPYWQERSAADQQKRAAASIRTLLSQRNARAAERGAGAAQRARAAERGAGSAQRARAAERGASATICPSDVARIIGGESWRECMPLVREVAGTLVAAGQLRVLQRGREVVLDKARGPVRLALPATP